MFSKKIDTGVHKFVLRSCTICNNLPDCVARDEEDDALIHADKAKYGCLEFECDNPKIMREVPKAWRREYKKVQQRATYKKRKVQRSNAIASP